MNIGTMLPRLGMIVGALFLALATPERLDAQEYPRSELEEQLDALATERAQALNRAYYDYEAELEEAREEAQQRDEPGYFSDRRTALRADLEERVLRTERQYEERRADLLQAHTGERWEGGEAEDRFEQPELSAPERRKRRTRIARLNTELAQAWSDFHEAADELRARKGENPDWEGYEEAVSELEAAYQETISRIQERQRELRFEMARDGTTPEPDAAAGPSDEPIED